MLNSLSPSYIIDLINKISEVLFKKYQSYKNVETYIQRWHKTIDYAYDEYNEYPIPNFNIFYKDDRNEKIDIIKTLNNAENELIIQIAIDLNIEVVGIIYSIAKIDGLSTDQYTNATQIFEEAIKRVYDKPDEAIGLANSALETIIKHILEQGILDIKYNKKDTLYDLAQKILKGFELYPSKTMPTEINKIGSSLLCISQSIEALRSEKTKFHGKDSSQTIIKEPLYACFVVNCVATIGNFMISFYEKTYHLHKKNDNHNQKNCITTTQNINDLLIDEDIPF